MRIIDKNNKKDYYEVVAKEGVDLSRIYMRESRDIEGTFPLPGWGDDRPKWSWSMSDDNPNYPITYNELYKYSRITGNPSDTIGYIYVLFAGKLYGGLHFKHTEFGKPDENTFIWFEDTLNMIRQLVPKLFVVSTYYNKAKKEKDFNSRLNKILSIKGDEKLRTWAIENNISVAVASYYFDKGGRKYYYKVDPLLKDYSFQKVLDPYTAFQELDAWIGGVLGQNPQPSEVPDKYKIEQHGFDKHSFRKLPEKK